MINSALDEEDHSPSDIFLLQLQLRTVSPEQGLLEKIKMRSVSSATDGRTDEFFFIENRAFWEQKSNEITKEENKSRESNEEQEQ